MLWAMQEMTVLASLCCSPVIMRTLVTSEPTLTVYIRPLVYKSVNIS